MKQIASVFVLGALACVLALPAGADDSGTVVRVFQLKYRSVADASAAIQPLLSERGAVTVQPQRAVLTVQDQPQVLDHVAEVLAEFDRAPAPYRIKVELLEARNGPLPKGMVPVNVDSRVRRMFHYDSYVEVASTTVNGTVGVPASVQLGPDFALSFAVDEPRLDPGRITQVGQRSHATPPPATGSSPWGVGSRGEAMKARGGVMSRLNLHDVVLWQRVRDDTKKEPSTKEILRSNALLAPGQKVVLGAGASEGSPTALVLMLEAEHVQEK